MAGYSKLFSSIVTSSIWCEDNITLRVWIAMLATCNSDGIVEGSVPGFASLARVSPGEMRHALERLLAPDPDSRTPDNEGRRLEIIPGGWRILNYESYRNRCQAKDGSRAEYMKKYRSDYGGSWPTPKRRMAILERFNNRCVKCGGSTSLEIDHIIPRSQGGGDEESNLQVLCKTCNLAKRISDGNVRGNTATCNSVTQRDTAPASASASAYAGGTCISNRGFDVPDPEGDE